MNELLDKGARSAGKRSVLRAVVGAVAATLLLAACNSLTGVNDLNVSPGGVGPGGGAGGVGGGGSGTGGTASGAGGDAGGGPVGGAAGATSGGALNEACAGPGSCAAGLECVFGICRTICDTDSTAACSATSCFTDVTTQKSGCRTASETCADGAGKGDLVCGPDKVLRMPCSPTRACRGDQECISGSCIGKDEKGTEWGKCGKQGKSCANTDLTVCDIGKPGGHTDKCTTKEICEASVPGPAQTCVTCKPGETKCEVDGTSKQISGAVCVPDGSGYDAKACTGVTAQCNPAVGVCQKLLVDDNEVTQEQYQAFLTVKTGGTNKLPNGNPAVPLFCNGNDLAPNGNCLSSAPAGVVCPQNTPGCAKHPQVCVDWCDAFAYCASYGKKLCGKIGGTTNDNLPLADFADPGKSQWMNACTAAGRYAHATDIDDNYTSAGPTSIGQQCNGKDKGQAGDPNVRTTLPVDDAGLLQCKHKVSGYDKALNLLGNVREWESSCSKPISEDSASLTDTCRVRGGSFRTVDDDAGMTPIASPGMRCDADEVELRSKAAPDLGFRCCDL